MTTIITDHIITLNGEFLPAGTHQIDDKDVEAIRPYCKVVEAQKKTKRAAKETVDPLD